MRDSRGPVVPAVVGLAVGAGVCYCVYRVVAWRTGRRGGAATAGTEAESEGAKEEQPLPPSGGSLLERVSGISVRPSALHTASHTLPPADMDLPKDLEAHDLQNLIHLLESTEDPTIQEQALITLSNSAAFSRNQDIIRNLGGLSVVGKMLLVPITKVKEKAMNALNNLSMNVNNQEKLKVYVTKVCEETYLSPLNSELQLAGLRFLTNMSVTNNYQYMMASSIPCFLHLLLEGNERTQVQVLKVLVNLSANPTMTEHLLNAQLNCANLVPIFKRRESPITKGAGSTASLGFDNNSVVSDTIQTYPVTAPFLLSLFDSCIDNEILLRVLVFVTNISNHMKKDKSTATLHQYNEDSVFSVLWGNSTQYAQKLASLLYHPDTEIKEQVAKLIMQQ